MLDAHLIQYRPIGVLHTPFMDIAGTPILDLKPYIHQVDRRFDER